MKKKMLSIFLVLTIVFTLSFPITLFAETSPTRLAGSDRYETASAIAEKGWTQSDYAVLVYGANFPDALSSTPLAKKYDAPILLTTTNSLPNTTKQTLTNLKVKNVFVIGGTGIISANVESQLKSMGIETTRIFGQDRYDTSVQIAKYVTPNPSSIFVVTGEDFPDGLSVSPIAAIKQMPIILVPSNKLPQSVSNYITSNSINETYIVGYKDIVSDTIANKLPNVQRLTGADKYGRNISVNKYFGEIFNSNGGACIATGENFADALTGAAYASKVNEPIILVSYVLPTDTRNYYQQRSNGGITVFGGTGVISDELISSLETNAKPPTTEISFANPADLNTYQTITVTNSYRGDFKAEITVEQIIRGSEAWSRIYAANQFNNPPKDGYEYLMAYIDYKLLDISGGKSLSLFGSSDFKLVSQDGRKYSDFYSVVEPDPQFDTTLYKGASTEGWVSFLVKTTDVKPVISYHVNYDGTGGAWFKAYGDSVTPSVPNPTAPTSSVPAPIQTESNSIIKDISGLKTFLETNYSTLQTCIGQTHFTFSISENTNSFTAYDYWIQVGYEYDFFTGAMTSIKYTDEQKNQLRNELKAHQESLAKAVIAAMPNKKFYGGYYDSWYKYPNLRVDLQTRYYYTWSNYDQAPLTGDIYQIYNSTKPSNFRWWDFMDDKL